MGIEKGNPVLQELLAKFAELMMEQDDSIAELKELRGLIAGQNATIEQVKKDVDGSIAKVDATLQGQNRDIATLGVKIASLEDIIKQAPTKDVIEQMRAQIDGLVKDVDKAGQGQKAIESSQAAANKRLDTADKEIVDLKGQLDRRVADLGAQLNDINDSINAKLKEHDGQLEAHTVELSAHSESLKALTEALEAARVEAANALKDSEEALGVRIGNLETVEAGHFEELSAAVAKQVDPNRVVRLEQAVKLLREAEDAREDPGPRIDALHNLTVELQKLVEKLRRENNALKERVAAFLDKGASATVRCLSCSSRKMQQASGVIVGTDGKAYLRTGQGSTVNLGRIPNAGLSVGFNVPGSKSDNGLGSSPSSPSLPSISRSSSPQRHASPARGDRVLSNVLRGSASAESF
eukprot:gnl/TRDRNA2_/TRDRNA2_126565_c0_seq1.p1 gnl/TRDRNA2_/TRDRNA2_126565_c0~~gnl/TRDRNA2_/TRDRNA2_126565_c0_seq1.p1  ORF type:complete len:409 (-),score=105.16 gnl/TRDRNA2_/TRDRNA2_126565_c0_seq1:11-1237(-)